MTQQSHSQAYTLRKSKFKKIHVPQCSFQHYLQQLKPPRYLSIDGWIKKLWYIYTMEYYLAITRNTVESVIMGQMSLGPIIQSEVSQKEKEKHHILKHIYGIQKDGTEEFIFRAAREKQIQKSDLWTRGEGRRERDILRE